MLHIQIITGSTRPGRKSKTIAEWVAGIASQRTDATFEVVDIAAFELPIMDEPEPPLIAEAYTHVHTRRWAAKIAQADGYLFVTPEYNASVPGALKNAIDYLHREWVNKPAGCIGYGSNGGVRAVEHLRGIAGELQIADVRESLHFFLARDFTDYTVFTPNAHHERQLVHVIDQVISWAVALKPLRNARTEAS